MQKQEDNISAIDAIHEKWSQVESQLEMAEETLKQIVQAKHSVEETIIKLKAQIDVLKEVYSKLIPDEVKLEVPAEAPEVVEPAPTSPQS